MNARHISAALAILFATGCASSLPTGKSVSTAVRYDTSMFAAKKAGRVTKDSVMVQVKRLSDIEAIASEYQLSVRRSISAIRVAELATSKADATWMDRTLEKLNSDFRISFAEPNLSLKPKDASLNQQSIKEDASLNDPMSALQYSLDNMQVKEAWKVTQGDPKVVVAVIDSGVDSKHADLKANLSKDAYNAFTKKVGLDEANPSVLSRLSASFASLGHGTHVSGIIAAVGNNKKGIVGVAPHCTILPIKIFPDLGDKSQAGQDPQAMVASAVADGLVYAADHGASIINMSLGFTSESKTLETAVNYALGKNVTVLVAAGNERMEGSPINTLAAIPGVIGVGATDEDDKVTFFSNAGNYVSISAPGWRILSTMPSIFNGLFGAKPYQYMDGTSMACPNAAGVAALVKSANPSLTPAKIKEILEKSSDDCGPTGRDDDYGYGRINAAKAVALAR